MGTTTPPPAPGAFRIGAGSGFGGDRYEPAVQLAEAGVESLVFECLAERTIALAQQRRLNGGVGFDERILRRVERVLPVLAQTTSIITNAGAADPRGAAVALARLFRENGRHGRIVAVTGDDVLRLLPGDAVVMETGRPLAEIRDRVLSANAYLGAEPIRQALDADASAVITGRVGDASLFLAPILHHFAAPTATSPLLAGGTMIGHLLECAGQLTGGYFADADRNAVPGLARLGFPFADVTSDGAATLGKPSGTGGLIDRRTVLQQLLYEIEDLAAYITPDALIDLSQVDIRETGPDAVHVSGAIAHAAPPTLKVSVGVDDAYLATAEISYAGADCARRADLATQIIAERWSEVFGYDPEALRVDRIGVNSTRPWFAVDDIGTGEVRLRFSTRTTDHTVARTLAEEVEALYTNGPAGGGGAQAAVTKTVGIVSTLIDRRLVEPQIEVIA